MADFEVVPLHGNQQRDYGILTSTNKCRLWLDRFVICEGTTSLDDNPDVYTGTKIKGSDARWRTCGFRYSGQVSILFGDSLTPYLGAEFRICKSGKGYAFIQTYGNTTLPNTMSFWFNSGSFDSPKWNRVRTGSAGQQLDYAEFRIKFGENRKNTNVVELNCCYECENCHCVKCDILGRFRLSYGWGNAYKPYEWTAMVNAVTREEPINLTWLNQNGVPVYNGGWHSALYQGSDKNGQINSDYMLVTYTGSYYNPGLYPNSFMFKVMFTLTETEIKFGEVTFGDQFLDYWGNAYDPPYDVWLYSFIAYVDETGTAWALGYHEMGYRGAVAPTCRSGRTYPFNFYSHCVSLGLSCCDRVTVSPVVSYIKDRTQMSFSYNGKEVIATYDVDDPNGIGFPGVCNLRQGMTGNRDLCRNEIYLHVDDIVDIGMNWNYYSGLHTGVSGTIGFMGASAYQDLAIEIDFEAWIIDDEGTRIYRSGMTIHLFVADMEWWDMMGSYGQITCDGNGVFTGTISRNNYSMTGKSYCGRYVQIYIWKISGVGENGSGGAIGPAYVHMRILGYRFKNCRGESIEGVQSYDCIRRYQDNTLTPIPWTIRPV